MLYYFSYESTVVRFSETYCCYDLVVFGFFFTLSTFMLIKGLNSLDLNKMSLLSDSSFFYGIKGRFEYLSITLVGSENVATGDLSNY